MTQDCQLLDFYYRGVVKPPISRGQIMMPQAKSVQPGADKRTATLQLSCIIDGGCLWFRGMGLTL